MDSHTLQILIAMIIYMAAVIFIGEEGEQEL